MPVNLVKLLCSIFLLFNIACVSAQENSNLEQEVNQLKHRWAVAKYRTAKEKQLAMFDALIKDFEKLTAKYPKSAQAHLWHGTALSTYGSLKGGLGGLSAAKKARVALDKAIQIDPKAEKGQAYVIMGALYSKVPGKPIGFGDKDIARSHLSRAQIMNPNSLDANFYYAEFLKAEGEINQAKKYYEKALKCPINNDFLVADEGRRKEAFFALEKL